MAQKTWPSSGTSPSISCAQSPTSAASGSGENAPHGTQIILPLSSDIYRVNPDSEPCLRRPEWQKDAGVWPKEQGPTGAAAAAIIKAGTPPIRVLRECGATSP